MQELCHRCSAELATADGSNSFCPHCGAPQLVLSEYAESLSTGTGGLNSTGSLPPPLPNPIDWEMAIRCTLLVAAVAAVLSFTATRIELLSPLSSLWILSASLITLALYQRRRPLAAMNARIGARIGALVGVGLGLFLAIATATGAVLGRFVLHSMGDLNDMIQASRTQIDQLIATKQLPPPANALVGSPEFRTGFMLFAFALGLFFILIVSIFGGALGGLLRSRRRPLA
ncbi:MAG TPA: hypothetical protein VH250_02415 [Granulicella sp.]|jgi:hypothetical protein|nr:hypothetical protein [Granulicella sp.]